MPSTLDPGDRKLLLVAGAILLLLIVATVVLTPSADEAEGQGIPTTYSTTKSGAQAAYLLLRELGYQSERWEKSPTELPSDAEGMILILADPSDFPDKKDRDALLAFVRSGGWIVYAGNFPFLFLESGAVAPPSFTKTSNLTAETFSAIAPSPFTQGASKITMNASNRWVSSDGAQLPLYGEPEEPGGNLAPRKRARPLVGRSHSRHEFGNFARGELAFFPGLHSGGSARRKCKRDDGFVERIFSWLQGIPVGLFQRDTCAVGGLSTGPGSCFRLAGLWAKERAALRARRCVATFAFGVCRYARRLVPPRQCRLGRGTRGLSAIPHAIGSPARACAFDFKHAARRRRA